MIRSVILFVLIATAYAKPSPLSKVPQLDGRIVGGEEVDIKDIPYQVALLWYGSHVCGGTIISEIFIVTAAHCTDGDTPSILTIRAGSNKPHNGGVVFQVAKIHEHPLYNKELSDYDMTILELAGPLTFGPGIDKVTLPTLNQVVPAGVDAVVSGWGDTDENGTSPATLQAVTVQMVSNKDCNVPYEGRVTDRMACAGSMPHGGKGGCFGDSGGPLTVDGVLVGSVSWGYGCARPDWPSVYGSVTNMRGFITEITGI